jgi:hypothetical protein
LTIAGVGLGRIACSVQRSMFWSCGSDGLVWTVARYLGAAAVRELGQAVSPARTASPEDGSDGVATGTEPAVSGTLEQRAAAVSAKVRALLGGRGLW